MYICFVCEKQLPTIKVLKMHFKMQHHFNALSKYSCRQTSCMRDFHSAKPFFKHLAVTHKLASKSYIVENTSLPVVDKPNIDLGKQVSDEQIPVNSDEVTMKSDEVSSAVSQMSPDEFKSYVEKGASSLVAKLYSMPSMPRSIVQDVVDLTTDFLGDGFFHILREKVMSSLNNCNDNDKSDIEAMFKILQSPFDGLDTEFLRLKHFENDSLIKPISYCVGERISEKRTKDGVVLANQNVYGQFVSMRSVLYNVFKIPGVLQQCLDYVHEQSTQQEPLCGIFQCRLWKNVCSKFSGKLVLPIFLYYDDFEINNPLGSSAGIHKLGAVYYCVPGMPPHFLSSLENIFLALLFHSSDRLEFGNKAVFKILIDELIFLETHGIAICTSDGNVQVYFVLMLILGDNLGLHSILGLVESFSANFACRFCTVNKEMLKNQLKENVALLRTENNYDSDLALANPSATGLKEKCIWNIIPSFHILSNISCDIMHDLLEGVCRYDMASIMNFLVFDAKLFSLNSLNCRIRHFDYGYIEKGNIPPIISAEHLKKGYLIMSASEMLCLVRYFGIMIGDLVNKDNEVWQFYLILRQIIDLITCKSIQSKCAGLLSTLITEHNETYQKLFKMPLKPKFHFLLHYPRIMLDIGPLVHVSSMRFEAKHKEFKSNAHVVSSRKNITLTLALKHQLLLSERLIAGRGLVDKVEVGPNESFNVSDIPEYEEFANSLPFNTISTCINVVWVNVKGTIYKPGLILVIKISNDLPVFGIIKCVLLDEFRNVFFVTKLFETICFNEHCYAYEVDECSIWCTVKYDDLIEYSPTTVRVMANGVRVVAFRYAL